MSTFPVLPQYGKGALSDAMPSVLAGLVGGEFENILHLPPFRRAVILLVDGLGYESLLEHKDIAPTLTSGSPQFLTTGFPSTTAAGITSLGTGLPSGQHGLVGYTMANPTLDGAMSILTWSPYGVQGGEDLSFEFPPLEAQPFPTGFERAVAAGIPSFCVSNPLFENSPFSQCSLRGGKYIGAASEANMIANVVLSVQSSAENLTYCYLSNVDAAGHIEGVGTPEWKDELQLVDIVVSQLVAKLPSDTLLIVTADHGMINVPKSGHLDFASIAGLSEGVKFLAGEPRARYVYTHSGAAKDVLQNWRNALGDAVCVVSREEAIEAGWFGPVRQAVVPRIGDVIVISKLPVAIVDSVGAPQELNLVGQHGSMTSSEMLIPLLQFFGSA